eukprot:TRINITY_DN7651_c0_g1_i1.p1 TRINITY_DN7651_c0_g1~~TRINITY_DN7651_c0_g1_i1.p1  ORF type:complete len:898 (+),score=255.27 TRINITY_DN7651_c0_g1_i1:98-2695(+)
MAPLRPRRVPRYHSERAFEENRVQQRMLTELLRKLQDVPAPPRSAEDGSSQALLRRMGVFEGALLQLVAVVAQHSTRLPEAVDCLPLPGAQDSPPGRGARLPTEARALPPLAQAAEQLEAEEAAERLGVAGRAHEAVAESAAELAGHFAELAARPSTSASGSCAAPRSVPWDWAEQRLAELRAEAEGREKALRVALEHVQGYAEAAAARQGERVDEVARQLAEQNKRLDSATAASGGVAVAGPGEADCYSGQWLERRLAELSSGLRAELRPELHSELHAELQAELHSELCSKLQAELQSDLHSKLHSELRAELQAELHPKLHDAQLHSELGAGQSAPSLAEQLAGRVDAAAECARSAEASAEQHAAQLQRVAALVKQLAGRVAILEEATARAAELRLRAAHHQPAAPEAGATPADATPPDTAAGEDDSIAVRKAAALLLNKGAETPEAAAAHAQPGLDWDSILSKLAAEPPKTQQPHAPHASRGQRSSDPEVAAAQTQPGLDRDSNRSKLAAEPPKTCTEQPEREAEEQPEREAAKAAEAAPLAARVAAAEARAQEASEGLDELRRRTRALEEALPEGGAAAEKAAAAAEKAASVAEAAAARCGAALAQLAAQQLQQQQHDDGESAAPAGFSVRVRDLLGRELNLPASEVDSVGTFKGKVVAIWGLPDEHIKVLARGHRVADGALLGSLMRKGRMPVLTVMTATHDRGSSPASSPLRSPPRSPAASELSLPLAVAPTAPLGRPSEALLDPGAQQGGEPGAAAAALRVGDPAEANWEGEWLACTVASLDDLDASCTVNWGDGTMSALQKAAVRRPLAPGDAAEALWGDTWLACKVTASTASGYSVDWLDGTRTEGMPRSKVRRKEE